MPLHFDCFLHFSREEFTCLSLLNFVDFSEGTATELLYDSVAFV
jgi:hypothetical protein